MTEFYTLLHAQQKEHAVVALLELEELTALGEEQAYQAVEARAQYIEAMDASPLGACYIPRDWYLFLLELCEKRITHPGAVLEMFVSGGIRAGKSFIAAMLFVCHWLHTKNAFLWALAETEATSKDLQQTPIEYFLPSEVMGGESGKVRQGKHQKMKFSGGAFTGGEFERYLMVKDERGVQRRCGGKVRFRYFSQSVRTMRGFPISHVWSDEAVPVDYVEAAYDRLASRAVETNELAHKEKMLELKQQLTAALKAMDAGLVPLRPHPALLGALMHGVHLITYTPEEGFTPTVRYFAQGAVKPERFKVIAPELRDKPGIKDARVPKIAYPQQQTRLLCYLHTSANKVVNAYPELSRKYAQADEASIRIKLYGDAEAAENRLFYNFSTDHLCEWKDISRVGTLYEVVDFGDPCAVVWQLVDPIGRQWWIQEWPCPTIEITYNERPFMPGPWAVPSKGAKLNGDPGTAYKMQLDWPPVRMVAEIWRMRQRILERFAATGEPFKGRIETHELNWKESMKDWSGGLKGDFAMPHMIIPDKRGVEASVGGGRTIGDDYEKCENGITFDRWDDYGIKAPSDLDKARLLKALLSDRVNGMPKFQINKECENSIFMLNTMSLPPNKENAPASDEVCVDWFDCGGYLERWEPKHIDKSRWVNADQTGFGYG